MPAWAPARLTAPTRALGCVPVLAQMRAERAKQPAACKRAPELSLRRLKYTWNCRGTPDTGRTTRLASIGPTGVETDTTERRNSLVGGGTSVWQVPFGKAALAGMLNLCSSC
jgi:hypothetical protein